MNPDEIRIFGGSTVFPANDLFMEQGRQKGRTACLDPGARLRLAGARSRYQAFVD